MTPRRCIFCGREGRFQHHHLTGKDSHGNYLAEFLKVPVCHDHHTLSLDDWYTLDLTLAYGELTWIDRVQLQARRLAVELTMLDISQGSGTLWGLVADALALWAGELCQFMAELDARDPEWRNHGGFYPPDRS